MGSDDRAAAWHRLLAENAEQQARPYPPPPPSAIVPAIDERRRWARRLGRPPKTLAGFVLSELRIVLLAAVLPASVIGYIGRLVTGEGDLSLGYAVATAALGAIALAMFLVDLHAWRHRPRPDGSCDRR